MIYDTKVIIVYRKYFGVNRKSIFIGSVRPTRVDCFYGFHWQVKERLIFSFNELLDRERVCICL